MQPEDSAVSAARKERTTDISYTDKRYIIKTYCKVCKVGKYKASGEWPAAVRLYRVAEGIHI
jgi:hypothetical protein